MRVGMRETFLRQAGRNIEKINSLGVETVVTACSGCYGIMKHEYPEVAPFAPRVVHVSELIAGLVEDGSLELGEVARTVTYHDPCHLARHGGVTDAPRKVLEAIRGLKVTEMARTGTNARCCGGGGGLRTGHTESAVDIAAERQAEAAETGAGALVTCCPFCEMNLFDALTRDGGLPVCLTPSPGTAACPLSTLSSSSSSRSPGHPSRIDSAPGGQCTRLTGLHNAVNVTDILCRGGYAGAVSVAAYP